MYNATKNKCLDLLKEILDQVGGEYTDARLFASAAVRERERLIADGHAYAFKKCLSLVEAGLKQAQAIPPHQFSPEVGEHIFDNVKTLLIEQRADITAALNDANPLMVQYHILSKQKEALNKAVNIFQSYQRRLPR